MSRYRKIDPRIWNDAKFRGLSDRGKLVFLFVLTHPHMTALGAMRATIPGMASEIGWPEEAFREAFREALAKALVRHDERASFVSVPNFLKYNRPESPNVVKAWVDSLDLIPECNLKIQLLQAVKAFTEGMGEAFRLALPVALAKAMPNAMPYQEQEQEQEQEREGAALNLDSIPINATAAQGQPQKPLSRSPKPENPNPADDSYQDLALLIVQRMAEYKYPTGGVRNLAPLVAESLRWVTESQWKVGREEAFQRMLATVERYLESPAGRAKAVKPARYWFQDDDYLLESWPIWEGKGANGNTNGNGKAAATVFVDADGRERDWSDIQAEMRDARVSDCFKHGWNLKTAKPASAEELAARGKTLFEFAQQVKWGKILVHGDGSEKRS